MNIVVGVENISAKFSNILRKYYASVFYLDLRSISVLRIGVGFTLLIDLALRMTDLEAHYTYSGILPAEALFRFAKSPYTFSLFTLSDTLFFQAFLFLINIVAVLFLLVGYNARVFTVICWLFLLSLHNRNPLIVQGGDDLLRMLLFWGMFLPWGKCFSVDSAGSGKETTFVPPVYISLAGFAYITQLIYMYVFSALLKNSAEWTTDFTALYYALSLDQIVYEPGKMLLAFPFILKFMTAAVYYLELYFPFVLLLPWNNQRLRSLFFVVFLLFHIGISLSMNVGLFPLISIIAMLGILPGGFLDKLKIRNLFDRLGNWLKSNRFLMKEKLNSFYPKESFLVGMFALLFSVYVFASNAASIGKSTRVFESFTPVGEVFRVNQNWGMFAPEVFKDDGWFIFKGIDKKGLTWDIKAGQREVSFSKPSNVAATFKNDRWRKYHEHILFYKNTIYRQYYCAYLLEHWNKSVSEDRKIKNLRIIFMKEFTLPDFKESKPQKEILCECEALF